jgi:RNA polymerase sigma-70 factor (ECF subfamily)
MDKHLGVSIRSTADLVGAAQSGDRAAFAELVRRYERAVVSTAWAVLHDYHAAQDVAQESFVIVFGHLEKLRNAQTFGPWLLKVTRREAIRLSRRKPATVSLDSTHEAATETPKGWSQEHDALVNAIGRLPAHEREVVVFHYLEGYSMREVAELSGRPVGTVTKQISRGVGRLRKWLAKVPK